MKMTAICHSEENTTGGTLKPSKRNLRGNPPNDLAPVNRVDSILITVRKRKISLSACHAIIKLYIASRSNKESILLSTLAEKIGVTSAAITSVVDTMENEGLAIRQRDTMDRRSVFISLTPEGASFAESLGAIAHS